MRVSYADKQIQEPAESSARVNALKQEHGKCGWLRNSKRASVARVWVKNLEGNELREIALQNMGVLSLSPSVEWRVIEELWAEQFYDLIMFPKDKSDALSRLD